MGTDNPKVSAYVPQAIKDRLKEFRKERDNISESQAVTIILAEYFQMPEVLGRSPEMASTGGVTLGRMEALEGRLTDFAASVEYQLQQLQEEVKRITGELPVVHQVVLDELVGGSEQGSSLPSEPQAIKVAEKPDETPITSQTLEQAVTVNEQQDSSILGGLTNEPPSELLTQDQKEGEISETSQELDASSLSSDVESELPVVGHTIQEERLTEVPEISEETGEPASSSLGKSPIECPQSEQIFLDLGAKEDSLRIDIDLLARRLGMAVPSVRNKKSKSTDKEFTEWTMTKDNGIGWKAVKQGKRVYYEPTTILGSELLNELLTWIRKNRG
jgi:hypothetical protein